MTELTKYDREFIANHAHILLRSGQCGLSKFMRRFLTGYAITYNRRHHGPYPIRLDRSGEGVPPLQFGETSEIRIGRGQLAAMFNGKSCQMCVCHQIGDSLTIREYLLENSPVSLGRPNDSRTGLIQPALYTSKCLFEYCLREKF